MGKRYLIDTNVIIDYAALRLPNSSINFIEQIFNSDFLVSVIVKIELLGFNDIPDKLQTMEKFLNGGTLLSLDESITQQTILLRRNHKKLKLGDAIIAATAIVHNLTLISHNTKDFININQLQLLDAYKIIDT